MKSRYAVTDLVQMGKADYDKLVSYCNALEMNGFWEQARQVMKQSSTEVLDRYVQSVLMSLAVRCGQLLENQKEYISLITQTNPFCIEPGQQVDDTTIEDCIRFAEFPPILLQLCGVYDQTFGKNIGEYFLDSFLNILLCMAYLNDGKDKEVNDFVQEYYEKICSFMNESEHWNHKAYLHQKLEVGEIACAVTYLHRVDKKTVSMGPVELQTPPKETKKQEEKSLQKDVTSEKIAQDSDNTQDQEARTKQLPKEPTEKTETEQIQKDLIKKEEKEAREHFNVVKKRIQEREEAERQAQEQRLEALIYELNSLVGLEGVKTEIQSLINLIKIRKLREKMGMPTMDMSYHMVFTGAPGTGKTTVARLVSRIYKELGLLSKGTVIETDRSGLVAGYVGQTALKVHDLVQEALGGVLFIDEAYALVNPEVPNDFGMEAVDTLVKLMEDHRDDLVIIVAGYTEEMKAFLRSNTGLVSRFNKFIDFPDYSKQELLDILDVMSAQAGLLLESEAKQAVLQYLDSMTLEEQLEFGNARGIRNLFEKIVMNQANRLILESEPTRELLMMIKAEDVLVV